MNQQNFILVFAFNEFFRFFCFCQFHKILLNGITCIDSHSEAPLVAIGTNDGFVSILEFNLIDQPTIFAEHHVCHDSIRKTIFSGHGNDVIAIDQNGGIYVMEVSVCGRDRCMSDGLTRECYTILE